MTKRLTVPIATLALALASPLASATAQLELLPDGVRASYVPPQIENPANGADIDNAKRFFNRSTGGVPPR
ncbi:MAG: hypothetical protein KJ025_21400 [Burkholderiales bacterium]|nr:hypothetical protein [Burkholderiales bacterium]